MGSRHQRLPLCFHALEPYQTTCSLSRRLLHPSRLPHRRRQPCSNLSRARLEAMAEVAEVEVVVEAVRRRMIRLQALETLIGLDRAYVVACRWEALLSRMARLDVVGHALTRAACRPRASLAWSILKQQHPQRQTHSPVSEG